MAEKESKLNLRLTAQNEGSPAFIAVEQSMKALQTTAETVSSAVSKAIESMNTTASGGGSFSKGMGEDAKAMNSLSKAMEGLQTKAEISSSSIKSSMEAMNTASQSGTFTKNIANDEAAVKTLSEMVAKNTEAVSKAFVSMEESVSRSSSATEKSVGGIKSAIGDAGLMVGLQQVGQSMEHLGEGGAHLFKEAITSASDFEASISRIHAVLMNREPTANMKDMSDTALKLGSNSKFSANEIAQGMYDLARQGLSSSQILGDGVTGAIETVNNLAQSVDGDMGETAKVVTDVLHEFNLSGKDLSHVGDLISGSMHTSSISMNDFYYAIRQIGPVASNMHQSVDDVSTGIALLAQHGITGSSAGTALKNMFLGLEPRTKKAAELMQELGINAKEGAADSFYQLSGNLKPMPEIIGILNDKFGDLNDHQKQAALAATFTKYGLAGLNVIVGEGKDKFNELKKTLGDEKAADIAREKLNNLQGDMLRLKAATMTMGKTFGDTLQPAMRAVADAAESVVHWFTSLSPEIKTAAMVGLALVSAMAIIGGAILTVVSTIGFLSLGLTGLELTLGAVLAPIGIVIAIIAALGLAAYGLYQAWTHNFGGIQEKTKAVWSYLTTAFNAIKTVVVNTVMTTVHSVVQWWNELVDKFKNATGLLRIIIEAYSLYFKMMWETMKFVAKAAVDIIWGVVKAVFTTMRDFIKEIFGALKDIFAGGFKVITGIVDLFIDLLSGNWKAVWKDIKDIVTGAIQLLKGIFEGMWTIIKTPFVFLGSSIKNIFSSLATDAIQWGSNIIDMFVQGISGAIHKVTDAVKNVADSVAGFLGFHSPAKEGPGADADTWMPNLFKMMTDQIHGKLPDMHAALNLAFNPSLTGVDKMEPKGIMAPVMSMPQATMPFSNNGQGRNNKGSSIIVNINANAITVNGAGKNGQQMGQDIMQGIRQQIGFVL